MQKKIGPGIESLPAGSHARTGPPPDTAIILQPFVKWSFELEIHGGTNLSIFCCVLRETRCHRVRFSCYFRQNASTINVPKLDV